VRDAVICEPLRTPVGRYGGSLGEVSASTLAVTVLEALLSRTGIDPHRIDDVILGHGYPSGEAPAIGRVASLDADLPVEVPGLQIDRRCGSGLQAVLDAAMRVQTGAAEVLIAGGTESMSQVEHYVTGLRFGVNAPELALKDRLASARVTAGGTSFPVAGGMLETAENLRRDYDLSRTEQDELAVRSHERAVAAQHAGRFDAELVPVVMPRKGGSETVTVDEHPRPGTSIEALAGLRPVLGQQDPEATVTAGNSAGQNDGAAACIVTNPDTAAELSLRPLARLRGWAVAGVRPDRMGLGPVPATKRALEGKPVGIRH
jgi:acetyl-CoA C-acetyltransferase